MSWSRGATRRRLLVALGSAPWALAGCNLRPLHGGSQGAVVNRSLAEIEVRPIGGRLGQVTRNYLIDELNPAGLAVPPTYRLELDLKRDDSALAIQLDDTITRFNLIVAASFSLRRTADDRVVYRSAARRVSSFNVDTEPFATLIAEQDAERRAVRELTRQIRAQLVSWLNRQPA
jgi:LPS-assembly lipoprotein